jgi:hypothetical protein
MSNIIETPKVEATLSAGARKVFSSFPCADMARGLIYRDGTSDETSVVPSDVRMTSAAAAAALGAKMSPQSFVAGLVFAAVRHAHGNQFPVENLPAGSKVAVAAACGTLPRGKGCSARMLLAAVEAGLAALLALPAPAARSKVAIAAPAAVEAVPAPAPVVDAAPVVDTYVDGAVNADADSAIAETAANAAVDATATAAAKALADAAEAAECRASQAAKFATDAKMAADTIVTAVCGRADAEAILRQLAQELGFSLRKVSRKVA